MTRPSAGPVPKDTVCSDTICAIATPPGVGSIAVVRMSGPDTLKILDRVFRGPRPSRQQANTCRTGWIRDQGSDIDQVVLTAYRAPRSYTGEQMAEVSCHGGSVAASAVLALLCRSGCRLARPGEFTRRAVLNRKLSLSQAEAVLDLVQAQTLPAYRGALRRYQGRSLAEAAGLVGELKDLVALVEHHIGFDETDAPWPERFKAAHAGLLRRLDRAILGAERGRFLSEGARVAIIGRPNVGKSTLFNRLLGEERAVVTRVPGTTRDRIEETTLMAGVRVTLIDTGGMTARPGRLISRRTAQQTEEAIARADMVLAVFDRSQDVRPGDHRVAAVENSVCVLNKSDLRRRFPTGFLNGKTRSCVELSARTGANVAGLKRLLARRLLPGADAAFSGARQAQALAETRSAVLRSSQAPDVETSAFELHAAMEALGRIDPAAADGDILDRVFARFCVGK
ncbi:MAG: tRNA uridine-5-carboxymethylaminomethyl(34) synthesis GTPase MnmE [candidate division WOR-3 bacterium]|nr:MAG: tRNA uridine-5-carboxymethylaminomethyl(34) synthesis GTPase MnmE [candidate division WOR-3 bacterium]